MALPTLTLTNSAGPDEPISDQILVRPELRVLSRVGKAVGKNHQASIRESMTLAGNGI